MGCLCASSVAPLRSDFHVSSEKYVDTEPYRDHPPMSPRLSRDQVADNFLEVLRAAREINRNLKKDLSGTIGEMGWTEDIAKSILAGLKTVIREGRYELGTALAEAYDKARETALATFEFAKEHPGGVAGAVLLTVVAIGVLVLVAPWVVNALGFAELGPVEGTFAAWWQSRYAGFVPKGSLFSFLQRLGKAWA